MPTQVQFRRGTATENNAFTGLAGEITISTTDNTFRIHDGSTAGGHVQMLGGLQNNTGTTDRVSEGTNNLYFTNGRVDAEINSHVSVGSGLTYSDGAFAIDSSVVALRSYVDSAITNVIASAPGALDTLDELAAALGDDADFAGTMTTSLAAKAPLANPTFTGNAVAVTQAENNNSTRIATTAYVERAIATLAALQYAGG
tara:strand:+ start:2038 stop:2637 length:600 start_codon:yes stop_codon:yes gene_type:complete